MDAALVLTLLMIFGFFLTPFLIAWAVKLAMFGQMNPRLRILYFASIMTAAGAAYLMTYYYNYYADKNTRVLGWPFRVVTFERDSPTSAWEASEDSISNLSWLAFPLNFLAFGTPTSVLLLFSKVRLPTRTPQKGVKP